MDWSDRRTRFRALIEGDRCVHPGSVFDAMSARIAEDLGFEIGMFAGSTASLAVLGAPDHIVLTLPEFAGQAYRICRAGNLAILVDADHGYEFLGRAGTGMDDYSGGIPRPRTTGLSFHLHLSSGVLRLLLHGRRVQSGRDR